MVELCLKGLLKALGLEYPRRHDVGDAFTEAVTAKKLRVDRRIVDRVQDISAYLAKARSPAFYMEEDFSRERAETAREDAHFVLAFAEELTQQLKHGGRKMRVLFLCTGNSCRSQMAEGFLRHLAGDRFESLSAGTHPSTLNPLAVKAMAEVGIDISAQTSKSPDAFGDLPMDCVVTVCDRAKESCPVYPASTRHLHWSFEDPAEAEGTEAERMRVFRKVRDQIRAQIEGFLGDIDG